MKYELEKATTAEVLKRALNDTYAYYKDDLKRLLQNVASAAVAILFLWLVWGRSVMVSEVQVLIAGVAGAITWGLFVLIYNIIVAPVKLSYEKAINKLVADAESPEVDLVTNWVLYPPNNPSAIGVEVINREQSVIECYSFLRTVLQNDKEITRTVTQYTQRLSWNGGADKDRGIKCIETDGGIARVNVGNAREQHFCFETDKGDHNMKGNGTFYIELELRGTMGGNPTAPIVLSKKFIQNGRSITFVE